MANEFNSVQMARVKRSRFDLSHDIKLSFKMGQLVPSCLMEVIPGDTFKIGVENMMRFAPLISPVMHTVNVTTHFFFIPNRILWPEWEDFITGNEDYVPPYYRIEPGTEIFERSIGDYLGLPVATWDGGEENVSALPMAAYLAVYNEYYRDQNLIDEIPYTLVAGDNTLTFNNPPTIDIGVQSPLNRAWAHDYFTACLPFAQKGDAVQVPLTAQDDVPVEHLTGVAAGIWRTVAGAAMANGPALQDSGFARVNTGSPTDANYDPNGSLVVDIQAGATDINTLRLAFRLQEWLERNARGGTRYIEHIKAHFDVNSSDARLQRPEYIGGSYQRMVISEVLQTAVGGTPEQVVGQMAGHGISVGGGNVFKYRAEEHGWILGIVNVQPVAAYMQGLHKHWSRFDRLDYAWPTFAHIGEQEVKVKELYCDGNNAEREATFGYIPRYAEYRYMPSRTASEFSFALDFWHLARKFASNPVLNQEFVEVRAGDNDLTRIFSVADPSEDHIYAHIFNNVHVKRKLPKYGTPLM